MVIYGICRISPSHRYTQVNCIVIGLVLYYMLVLTNSICTKLAVHVDNKVTGLLNVVCLEQQLSNL